jgi:hypothetical protein
MRICYPCGTTLSVTVGGKVEVKAGDPMNEIRTTRPGYEADLVKSGGKGKAKGQTTRRYRNSKGEFVKPDEAVCTVRFCEEVIGDATSTRDIGKALLEANGDGPDERRIIAMITPALHYMRSGYALANEEPGCVDAPEWVKTAVDLVNC